MFEWLIVIITAAGSSVITCACMELYYQRRATEWVSEWEYEGIEIEKPDAFCSDCPDREWCMGGNPCDTAKAAAT